MITGPPEPTSSRPSSTENERAHDTLTELRLRDEQCTQLIARYDQGLDRFLRVRIDERRLASQLRQFAHERTRPVRDYQRTLS